jgi:hypothetical protein
MILTCGIPANFFDDGFVDCGISVNFIGHRQEVWIAREVPSARQRRRKTLEAIVEVKRPIGDLVAKHGRDDPGHVALEYAALDKITLVRDRAAGSPNKRVQPPRNRVR